VVVCPRVARLLFCYLLADNSFPKSDCYWKGFATPKEKQRVGKAPTLGAAGLIWLPSGGIQDTCPKSVG
jgi:hypothetical protein